MPTPTPTPTPAPGGCYWIFPWGIEEDPTAAFSRYLGQVTQDCVGPIALPTGGEPSTLLVVLLYDESVPGGVWKYWIPGYGGGMTQLESGLAYYVVVEGSGACTWNLAP